MTSVLTIDLSHMSHRPEHGLVASVSTEAPPRRWIVDQRHANADDTGPGDGDCPLRTITAAAFRAEAGDTVTVHEGVYRERVAPRRGGTPARPIVYEAASGERVVISGADLWRPSWRTVEDEPHVRYGELDPALFSISDPQEEDWPQMPADYNPFALALTAAPGVGGRAIDQLGAIHGSDRQTRRMVVGQMFLGDEALLQVNTFEWLRRLPGTWLADREGRGIYFHPPVAAHDLTDLPLEVTTRRCVFAPWRRGLGHIHVRGFILERSASNFPRGFYHAEGAPQAGVLSTRSGHHWIIEGNTIRMGTSLGLDVGTEGVQDGDGLRQAGIGREQAGHHLIRANTIVDNGAGGIAGIGSTGTRIVDNRIESNNRLGFTAPETGGIKMHFFEDGLIEGNLIRLNHCYGIWLDNMWHNARVRRNAVIANAGAGIFLELGFGPVTVDHNVVAQTRPGVREPGDGIYSHDASGVTLAHNLVISNAHWGLWAHAATDREAGVYEYGKLLRRQAACCSDWQIVQNIFASNHGGEVALPPEHERSSRLVCDRNVYAGTTDRWTHETHASPLDSPRFGVCDNKGRIDRRQIVADLVAALDRQGVPESERPTSARLLGEPRLLLNEWRLLLGHDAMSRRVPLLRLDVATSLPALSITVGPQLREVQTLRMAGLECDYHGTALPQSPLPGPFQDLVFEPALLNTAGGSFTMQQVGAEHENFILLWPRPRSSREELPASPSSDFVRESDHP